MWTKISLKKLTDTPEIGGKQPSHALVAADDKYENKVEIGKLWLKSGQYGNFLSGELSKEREYEGKVYEGYVIISQKEYRELIQNQVAAKTPSTPHMPDGIEF